jgi:hypothetical protein
LSFVISAFIDETEGLLEAVAGDEAEGVLAVELVVTPLGAEEDDDVVEATVGMAMLVPEPEEDPIVAAKAFPEIRIPTIAVAIPVFPMAIEMDFFDPFLMFPLLF